jgi:hypothetical protein
MKLLLLPGAAIIGPAVPGLIWYNRSTMDATPLMGSAMRRPRRKIMDAATPLIHIGYHKTASTWLQKQIFYPQHAGFYAPFHSRDIQKEIVAPNSFDFDPEVCRRLYAPAIEQARASGMTPVFSAERLSGHPYSGGFDSQMIADRLLQIFPKGKVLIVIREQKSIIRSAYIQYIKRGGAATLKTFLDRANLIGAVPLFSLDFYKYHRLISYYHQLYGQENVLVLPYELLVADRKQFVGEVQAFCGLTQTESFWTEGLAQGTINKSPSGLESQLIRLLNHIVGPRNDFNRHSLLPLPEKRVRKIHGGIKRAGKLVPKVLHTTLTNRMRASIAAAAGDTYRESNAISSELIGRDLGAYGYEVQGVTQLAALPA